MRRFFLVIWLVWVASLTQAQALPLIESFTIDNNALNYPNVELGIESANFSWRVTGLRTGDRMQMHALVGSQWGLIGENFDPIKTDTLVIAHPIDFIPPTYRLSVVDTNGSRVAERILELSYAPPQVPPTVGWILARVSSITPQSLIDGEPLLIHWLVYNRWQNSNLVFEQVLPDGQTVNIELPRTSEWVRAWGEGYVQPIYPGESQDIVLRLRVVNRDDNQTLAQKDGIVPVIIPGAPPAEVIRFDLWTNPGIRGGVSRLTWDVANANRVYITQAVMDFNNRCKIGRAPDVVYADLPPSGSMDIHIPADATGMLRFQLVPDRYIVESWNCEPMHIIDEIFLELEDYAPLIGSIIQTIEITPGLIAHAGDTLTLNYTLTYGQSVNVTITHPLNSQVFNDLPINGQLQIPLPAAVDDWVYINMDVVMSPGDAPQYLWSDEVKIDQNSNMACESFIQADVASDDDCYGLSRIE